MSMPQDPAAQSADVAAMAAQLMGQPAPGGAAADPMAAMQQQAPAKAKETQQDKAAEKGAPADEGSKSGQNPVIYEIQMGDKTRKMTPEQISSTFQRYAALNYQQAQYKPVIDAIQSLREANPNLTPTEIAQHMAAMNKAGEKNTTLGKGSENTPPSEGAQGQAKSGDAPDMETMLAKWEHDNAASLPPGYKEMMQGNGSQMVQMQQQMQQMQRMLQTVLAASGGATDAAKMGMQQAQGQQVQAMQQQIANNLDRVQQALKIGDDRANDFMTFAAERGFTLEDFIDPQLTVTVMQDFKNAMDSPEMARMREIAQRRQAYTGQMGAGLPGGGQGGAPAAASPLEEMTSMVMQKRGMA